MPGSPGSRARKHLDRVVQLRVCAIGRSMLALRLCPIGFSGEGISSTRRCRRSPITMASWSGERRATTVVKLTAVEATPTTFSEYGQVISASADGEEFGPNDAKLELHRGVPRFYIMHLEQRNLKFDSITHHASVTQCLGSVGGDEWFLGVAKASILNGEKIGVGKNVVKAAAGHEYVPPHPDDVFVFRVTGPKFLKLNVGTWHAGPLFRNKAMDFYNLELSDTNVVDHTTHYFLKEDGVLFEIED